jgi:hypothetical protein
MTGVERDAGRRGRMRQLRSVAQLLALAVLLVGPCAMLEYWAERDVRLIPYLQQGYRYRLEAKKLIFQQVDCPTSVVIGTSMTAAALNAKSIRAYREETGDDSFEPIFAFAAPGTRPIGMLGIWRWIRDQGCVPKYVFIESNPLILNVARGEEFERAFMTLRMQLEVSEDRFAHDEIYTLRYRADLATWWRSTTYRNREPIMKYLRARFFSKNKKPIPLRSIPPDGQLKPTMTKQFIGKFRETQYRKTLKNFKKGNYEVKFTIAYADAILALAQEAEAGGTRAIIHTPPVPDMVHEFMDIGGGTKPFCALYNRALSMPDIRWYSEYGDIDLPHIEFADWLHVNQHGASLYATRILSAIAKDEFPVDEYCRKR